MRRRLTTEEFIAKARAVHGDKYDYSKVVYRSHKDKVRIICPIHGEFFQLANSHLSGRGCYKCGMERTIKSKTMTKEQFIEKAVAVHGDFYDYSKVDYVGNKTAVSIVCPIHGIFMQKPNGHLMGNKCPKCANEHKKTRECNSTKWFVDKAILIHGDKYDYSKCEYKGSFEKVLIICKRHGVFYQTASTHLRGSGCPMCALENGRTSVSEFIDKSDSIHNHKYDYTFVELTSLQDKVHIVCPIHGDFYQGANEHMRGQGCPRCGIESRKHAIFGFGINDYHGNIVDDDGNIKPFYSVWHSMIRRCYSEYHQKIGPSYIGCKVCDEWKYLSKFKEWFDEHYIEGCHLDKDILVQGNRVYSPSTCCFVPQYINSLITDHRAARGECKLGVRKENGRYVATVNDSTKSVRLGSFETEDEAFFAYANAKREVIEKTAKKALDDGLITDDVFNALLNREIKEY